MFFSVLRHYSTGTAQRVLSRLTSAFRHHLAIPGICRIATVLSAIAFASATPQHPAVAHTPFKTAEELKVELAQVDRLFALAYARHPIGSITVGMISGPNLIWTKSYGLADIEHHVPATKDTVYRIGSITKQFTALMLLQLAYQEKVYLTDPVVKYFPEVKQIPGHFPKAPPITLLQLATDMSGLAEEPEDPNGSTYATFLRETAYSVGPIANWEKTLISALPHVKYDYAPGAHCSYSNVGSAILGAALERAAGQSYVGYVHDHIFVPLGMAHTAIAQNAEILRTLAKGYSVSRNSPPSAADSIAKLRSGRGYKVPVGSIFTTVEDLAKFVSMEMGDGPESILPKSVVIDNLARLYCATGDFRHGTGVGYEAERRGDFVVDGKAGAVEGYNAGAYFNPPSHIGIVYLRNAVAPELRLNDVAFDALRLLAK